MKLGYINEVGLADARDLAKEVVGKALAETDPAKVRDQYRAAETFADLCEKFVTNVEGRVKNGKLRPTTAKEYIRLVKVELCPVWGSKKIVDIARRDVLALLEEIETVRGFVSQARRVRVLLHQIFNYALQKDLITTSPCVGLPKQGRVQPKTRVLTADEITKVWQALEKFSPSIRGVFKLILLTAQRPGEVANLMWSEIRGDEWHLPATRTKNKRSHIIPLSIQARMVLHEMKISNSFAKKLSRKSGDNAKAYYDEFVFPSRRQGKATTWLNKRCRKIVEEAGVDHFSPHDLRRTAATTMRQLQLSKEVVAKILNHTPQDVTSLHYDHYELLIERKEALGKWGDYVESLTGACSSIMKAVA